MDIRAIIFEFNMDLLNAFIKWLFTLWLKSSIAKYIYRIVAGSIMVSAVYSLFPS